MDRFRNFDTYGFDILDDPALKTTADNFHFQYIPSEQFERVIRTVQRDRLKQKKSVIWTDLCRPSKSLKTTEKPNKLTKEKKTKSHSRKIIKTPTSTVKILTQCMVEKDSDEEETPRTSRDYAVIPKVRIMTDEEIQKVVDNAVKEVIHQHTRIETMKSKQDDTAVQNTFIEELNFDECLDSFREIGINPTKDMALNHDDTHQAEVPVILENVFEHRDVQLEENMECTQVVEDEETNDPKWIELNDLTKSDDDVSIHSESTVKEVIQSQRSVSSADAPNRHRKEFLEPKFAELNAPTASEDRGQETYTCDKKETEEVKNIALSSLERDELRKFLGIQEFIVNSDIDLDRFDEKETSEESEDEHEPANQKNIFPVIHIRQPAPVEWIIESEESDIEDNVSDEGKVITPIAPQRIEQIEKLVEPTSFLMEESSKVQNTHPQSVERIQKEDLHVEITNVSQRKKEREEIDNIPKEKEKRRRKKKRNQEDIVVKMEDSTQEKDTKPEGPMRPLNNLPQTSAKTKNLIAPNSAKAQQTQSRAQNISQNSARHYTTVATTGNITPGKTNKSDMSPKPNTPTLPKKAISPNKDSLQACKSSRSSAKHQQEISSARINYISEEKMAIFSKITNYQEKIIDFLDQLRSSLLNLTLPDGQPERKRREKHVIEFTARFGRNYLYQLDRLIEEIRIVPKDQYLNKYTNEYRTKICAIYGILCQAVQSYLKQIKYFLHDQSPRKLDVLIGFIIDATKICIHKKVFDKRDNLISCLLSRCDSFLCFLDEIQEKKTTGRGQKSKRSATIKTPSKWEAANPSKLSMYETSSAPSKKKQSQVGKKSKKRREEKNDKKDVKKNISEVKISSASDEKVKGPENLEKNSSCAILKNKEGAPSNLSLAHSQVKHDFEVNTQMSNMPKESITLLSPVSPKPSSSSNEEMNFPCSDSTRTCLEMNATFKTTGSELDMEMRCKVLEALQSITKQQVHKILGPLVSNLGFVLNENTSALDLETLLNGLNSVTAQVANVPPTGNGTFNQKGGVHNVYDDTEHLSEHAVSNEQQLGLSPSKQRAQALWNRQMNPPLGEDDYDVRNSSLRGTELQLTNRMELPTIKEERRICPGENEGDVIPAEDEDGANLPHVQNVKSNKEQQLRYDRNIQFIFVSAEDGSESPDKEKGMNLELSLPLEDDDSDQDYYDVENTIPEKSEEAASIEPPLSALDRILEERLNFIKQIADNPLYVNNSFSQPWKVVSRLTDKIVDELTHSVEKELSFGEDSYLEDFLRMELSL